MNTTLETTRENKSIFPAIISWLFGTAVLAVGVINMFWGNDFWFGVFLVVLSLAYFLPVNTILEKVAGFSIPKIGLLKIILGIFIIWAAFGVGELFEKIDLMMNDL